MQYFYYINLYERGDFFADVRNKNDETIYEIHGFDIFTDGFMEYPEDLAGLTDYLISLKIINDNDLIILGD